MQIQGRSDNHLKAALSILMNTCKFVAGKVVRQEIITESNGVKCIKNLTMIGEQVNVEQSCRNLSKY
jgi:hypothetical protein